MPDAPNGPLPPHWQRVLDAVTVIPEAENSVAARQAARALKSPVAVVLTIDGKREQFDARIYGETAGWRKMASKMVDAAFRGLNLFGPVDPCGGPHVVELLRDEDFLNCWDPDRGQPGIRLFANAVQVWSVAQNGVDTTVADAAAVFNVSPELIREAVDWHPWMFIGADDVIEHDGE